MIARTLTILLATWLACPPAAFGDPDTPAWVDEARQKSAQLGSRLKQALREALESTGPTGGVEVCKLRAPKIAVDVSDNRYDVGRTALRLRNPENAPDDWEASVLGRFEQRMAQGAEPAELEAWTVETTEKGTVGRYMKAIPTGPQCVVCHGKNVAPALNETIKRLYPEDRATGFAPGELRGAFTVAVALPAAD